LRGASVASATAIFSSELLSRAWHGHCCEVLQ